MSITATFTVQYRFTLEDRRCERFDLEFDETTGALRRQDDSSRPEWSRLTVHQCPNCTLDPAGVSHCPAALSLAPLVARLSTLLSYDHVDLEVVTAERRVVQRTTVQRAASSLMGLLLASSGCPRTHFFRPMARFHLPLATEEETIFRAAATYMLAQYFRNQRKKEPDFSMHGLNEIYRHIQILNAAMADRLRAASDSDSLVNAIILLDMHAKAMPYMIKQSLGEIEPLFGGNQGESGS